MTDLSRLRSVGQLQAERMRLEQQAQQQRHSIEQQTEERDAQSASRLFMCLWRISLRDHMIMISVIRLFF